MTTLVIKTDQPRPPFYLLPTFLWGRGHDYDSDGNSRTPEDTTWTELYCTNRSEPYERFSIEVKATPTPRIIIESKSDEAAARLALMLHLELGAEVWEGDGGSEEQVQREALHLRCGEDFDWERRSREVRDLQKERKGRS